MDRRIVDIANVTRDTDLKGALVRAQATIERAADKPLRVVVSTGDVDRYHSVIEQAGWNLKEYQANPVVLWMHDYFTPAIARSAKVEVDGDRLIAEPVFPERGAYPLADTVQDLVRGGFLNAASVGWQADEWTFDEKLGGCRYLKQTLLEWSFVTVPGNAAALVEARAAGVVIDPLRAHAEEILRRTGLKQAEAIARAGEAPRTFVLVRRIGDAESRVEAPSADELKAAVEILDKRAIPVRLDQQIPVRNAPIRDGDSEMPDTCECGREFGADDKFCAACGKERAEIEPDADETEAAAEIDHARVLEALKGIGA